MIETWTQETCKCCLGQGTQTNNDGIKVECPCCHGKGIKNVSNFDNLPPGIYCKAN